MVPVSPAAPPRPDVSVRFEEQRQIFANKASQYATIFLANMQCFDLQDDREVLQILNDAPISGSAWHAYSSHFNRIYTSQYGEVPDSLISKIGYTFMKQMRYVRSYFVINLLQNFLTNVIDNFSFNGISALTEGLSDQKKDLTKLATALIDIADNHYRKYVRTIEIYRGEELDGSFPEHAVHEMKMMGKRSQKEILSDFTKIIAKFLPQFKPLLHLRTSQNYLKKMIGYFLIPFDYLFDFVVSNIVKRSILPKLTNTLLEEGAKATTNNPFSFAITSSLIEELEKLLPTLRQEAAGAAPVGDVDAGAMAYVSEEAEIGIKSIAENLMKVMSLRADLANAAPKKDAKKQSLIEQQVNSALEASIQELIHLGLRSLTNDMLQDLLEKFLTTTNQYWAGGDAPDVDALNAKRDELSTQMDEVVLLSIQGSLRKLLKGVNPRLAGGGLLGTGAAIAGGVVGGPIGAGLGLALGGFVGRRAIKKVERAAQGIIRGNVDQLYGAVHELGHTQCAALNAMEGANQHFLMV